MCHGPIKIVWEDRPEGDTLDDRIAIFVSLDQIDLDGQKPWFAKVNRYDFFFFTLQSLEDVKGTLSIWFPFEMDGLKFGTHLANRDRGQTVINYIQRMGYVDKAIKTADTGENANAVIGWDAELVGRLLGSGDGDAKTRIRDQFDRFLEFDTMSQGISFSPDSGDLSICNSHPVYDLDGNQSGVHVTIDLEITERVQQGSFFHIWIDLENVEAIRLSDCQGQAVFYYYDTEDLNQAYDHPFRNSPLVPLTILNTILLTPRSFVGHPAFGLVKDHNYRPIENVNGEEFRDGFWFAVFAAHQQFDKHIKNALQKVQWRIVGCNPIIDGVRKYISDLEPQDFEEFIQNLLIARGWSFELETEESTERFHHAACKTVFYCSNQIVNRDFLFTILDSSKDYLWNSVSSFGVLREDPPGEPQVYIAQTQFDQLVRARYEKTGVRRLLDSAELASMFDDIDMVLFNQVFSPTERQKIRELGANS